MKAFVPLFALISSASGMAPPFSTYVFPAGAGADMVTDPMLSQLPVNTKADFLDRLSTFRSDRGACRNLIYDPQLEDDLFLEYSALFGTNGNRCPDINSGNPATLVTTFITVSETGVRDTADRTFFTIDEIWDRLLLVHANSETIMQWFSATRVGCVYCEQTQWDAAFVSFFYCTIAEQNGQVADNVFPQGTTCQDCVGVTCPDLECRESGVCDPTLGSCTYVDSANGLPCGTTSDTVCFNGVCKPAADLTKFGGVPVVGELGGGRTTIDKFMSIPESIISPAGVKVFIPNQPLSAGSSIYIACASSSGVCELFISFSHCPPCEVNGGLPSILTLLGWDSASCSPRTSKYPMVTFHKTVTVADSPILLPDTTKMTADIILFNNPNPLVDPVWCPKSLGPHNPQGIDRRCICH